MKHIDSINHITGRSVYLDDIPVLRNTLHAVVFPSPVAHGRITHFDVYGAESYKGVEKVFTWRDIPGEDDTGGIISDETLFAHDVVHYCGQPLALIVAGDERTARKAAKMIEFEAEELDVITDPRVAMQRGELLIPSRTFRTGDVEKAWRRCDHIFEGRADSGGQEHLYLETQGAYAYPTGNNSIRIHSSTQSPSLVQKIAARVLGLPMNRVEVEVARLGGAFGGKEDQATPFAVMAAMAAYILNGPVKLVLGRHDDLIMTGKRHPYSTDYRLGLSSDYRIIAYQATMYQNGGAAADLSPAIMERTLFHSANTYFIPDTEVTVHSCRTNLPPNTAFRGFGAPQGMFAIESAIAHAASELKIPAHIIQQKNLLKENNEFPYGQKARNVNIGRCFTEMDRHFNIRKTEQEIADFNAVNRLMKKGMAVMPVCFGISFTSTSMNQASALVHIYQDGSIGISTGAIEMGQGVNTKLMQVAARVLSVEINRIRIEPASTTRNANTAPTAASSGADLNGNALLIACSDLLERLRKVAAEMKNCNPDKIELKDEIVFCRGKETEITWEKLVQKAYSMRTDLSAHGHYVTPQIYFDRQKEKGNPFAYHVYGSAIVTVLLDCLRGVYKTEKVLIVHDFGNSINPDIDMGQVEGAVVQGLGWMTMEEVSFSNEGKLLTDSLSTYKVPDIYSAPDIIICHPLDTEGPERAIFKSKAVGEPPLMYGIGGYFAIQNAIRAFNPLYKPDFNAPMTPEKVLLRLYRR